MIVNGAVLRSVGRTDLSIENNAAILRGRDLMSPEEANTPARMMAYVDQSDLTDHQDNIVRLVSELMGALEAPEAKAACISFAQKVATGQFYKALADCRWLIGYEAEALQRSQPAAA